jgi:hypothetical protein
MTGYLWTAQDSGSRRRAKTGFSVLAETTHVPDVPLYSGIAPSRGVCVCLPVRSADDLGACATGDMRHDMGLSDLALLSRSCPIATLR